MSLGDLFPDNIKNQFAERNIDIGNAILIRLTDINVNYDKYIVIVGINNEELCVAYVIINTEINTNIAPTTYLKSLHLKIKCSSHTFLKHDSYINCSDLKEFQKQELIDFLIKNPERVVGNIDVTLLTKVYSTIKSATTILPILKKKYGFI